MASSNDDSTTDTFPTDGSTEQASDGICDTYGWRGAAGDSGSRRADGRQAGATYGRSGASAGASGAGCEGAAGSGPH